MYSFKYIFINNHPILSSLIHRLGFALLPSPLRQQPQRHVHVLRQSAGAGAGADVQADSLT